MSQTPDLVYGSKDEQISLLQSVLLANETDAELGSDIKGSAGDLPGTVTSKDFGRAGGGGAKRPDGASAAKRVTGSLTALSGAQSMSYIERNRSENKLLAKAAKDKNQPRHALFQKRAKVSRVLRCKVPFEERADHQFTCHRCRKKRRRRSAGRPRIDGLRFTDFVVVMPVAYGVGAL